MTKGKHLKHQRQLCSVRLGEPFLAVLFAVVLSTGNGCKPAHSVAAKTLVSPAKTSYSVAEGQLNTIELTSDAFRRLDLQTATVREHKMVRTRPYGADIVLPTGAAIVVSAPLAGTVSRVDGTPFIEVGQRVPEGQTLLQLMPLLSPERAVLTPAERVRFAEAKNTLAQSRIDAEGLVQQSQVQVDAAKIALDRAERLLRDKAGTVRMVDEAKAQRELAEKSLVAARNRLRQVEAVTLDEDAGTLEPISIPTPLGGMIRSLPVRPGELVAAGAPLFEVMHDDVQWVKVPVYVGDIEGLDMARPARMTVLSGRHSDCDEMLHPVTLPPTALPLAAAIDMYYELPNSGHNFPPGKKVTMHIPLRGDTNQIALPWSAVIHDIYGGQWVYEQTDERKFVRRRVDVAWVEGDLAAIRRGIAAGTKVVVAGAAELAGTEFGFAK